MALTVGLWIIIGTTCVLLLNAIVVAICRYCLRTRPDPTPNNRQLPVAGAQQRPYRSLSYSLFYRNRDAALFTEERARGSCSICLEELCKPRSRVAVLGQCSHMFHFACVVPWIVFGNSCPVCRRVVKRLCVLEVLESSAPDSGLVNNNSNVENVTSEIESILVCVVSNNV